MEGEKIKGHLWCDHLCKQLSRLLIIGLLVWMILAHWLLLHHMDDPGTLASLASHMWLLLLCHM